MIAVARIACEMIECGVYKWGRSMIHMGSVINLCLSDLYQLYRLTPLFDLQVACENTFKQKIWVPDPKASREAGVHRWAKKGSPIYQQFIENLPGRHIRKEIRPFLEQHKLRKDLVIGEQRCQEGFKSWGINFASWGDPVIVLYQGMHDIDPEACRAILKHEICHIKHSDACMGPLKRFFGAIAVAVLTFRQTESYAGAIIGMMVAHKILRLAIGQYQERRADRFAIEHSTPEELKGAWRFFQATYRILGNYTSNEHPLVLDRIRLVEDALRNRGMTPDRTWLDRWRNWRRIPKLTTLLKEAANAPPMPS